MSSTRSILTILTLLCFSCLCSGFVSSNDETSDVASNTWQPDVDLEYIYNSTWNITNDLKREIVRQQLRYCPFSDLCTIPAPLDHDDLDRWNWEEPCCRSCGCDLNTCEQDNTCCLDILEFPTKEEISANNYGDVIAKRRKFTSDGKLKRSCVPLVIPDVTNDTSIQSIRSCPYDSEQFSELCTREYTDDIDKLVDIVPCYSKVNHEIYRNRFCAYCNGLSEKDIEYFTSKLKCKYTLSSKELSNFAKLFVYLNQYRNNYCKLIFGTSAGLSLTKCYPSYSQCNITGRWSNYSAEIELACHSYQSRTSRQFGHNYANIFCLICNGEPVDDFNSICYRARGQAGPVPSFSILLKLETGEDTSTNSCGRNEILDDRQMKCRQIVCPLGSQNPNYNCKMIFDKMDEGAIIFLVKLLLVPMEENDDIFFLEESGDIIIKSIKDFVYSEIIAVNSVYFTSVIQGWGNSANIFYYKMEIEVHKYSIYVPSVTKSVMDLQRLNRVISINKTNGYNDAASIDFRMQIVKEWTDKQDNVEYFMTDLIDGPPRVGLQPGQLTIDIDSPLSCPVVNLSISENKDIILHDNVLKLANTFLVNRSKWYKDDQSVYICVDDYEEFLQHVRDEQQDEDGSMHFDIEVVISIICVSLSLLALIITLLSYIILPNLRSTLPGKILMLLCASLLVAQSLYLVPIASWIPAETLLCKIIGIALHFSWLLTFFTMNVYTFHTFRVLTRTRLPSRDKGFKKLVIYVGIIVLGSSCFVTINVIGSLLLYGHIGYGQVLCYISSQTMLYFTFALAVALVIVSNLGMFVAVVVRIKKTSNVTRIVQHERNNLVIFAKLSTITGLTWILGFIYIWTDIKAFSYLFIVFNASQGVFLCIAFIVNRRVLTMYKELSSTFTFSSDLPSRGVRKCACSSV